MGFNSIPGVVEVLGETPTSIVYALASDPTTARKGTSVWVGDEAVYTVSGANAQRNEEMLRNEARIYRALGSHARIAPFRGLDTDPATGAGRALCLARANAGWGLGSACLRTAVAASVFREDGPPPPLLRDRLRMAREFAEGVRHLHDRGVTWGDTSTRNALLYDGHVRLCDFAHSGLAPSVPCSRRYEERYAVPGAQRRPTHGGGDDAPPPAKVSPKRREMHALGCAVLELIQWDLPYGGCTDRDDVRRLMATHTFPTIEEGRVAEQAIRMCWREEPVSAWEVVQALKVVEARVAEEEVNCVWDCGSESGDVDSDGSSLVLDPCSSQESV